MSWVANITHSGPLEDDRDIDLGYSPARSTAGLELNDDETVDRLGIRLS